MLRQPIRTGWAVVALAGALLTAGPARAETALKGDRQSLSLAASNVSVDEVLKLLGEKFALRYRSEMPLERRLNGTYSGSLRRLLADVLVGYNYIIVWSEAGQSEVIILGAAGATPATIPMRTTRRAD